MKKFYAFIGCIVFLSAMNPAGVFAQRKITIKLASMAPENTPWGDALKRISRAWAEVTNGQVEMIVYHNGVAGEEEDVLQKLKINQLQAAVLTSFGISHIAPDVMTLSAPFLVRNDDELNAVLTAVKPELEAKINENGFQTLTWAKSGWVKVFSKKPVFVPEDLKSIKIGTSPDTPKLTQAFQSMGYKMVTVGGNDTLIALNSGQIEAVYLSPLIVGALQIFGITKNMASINVAPFMAGIFLNQRAWRSIPDQYKAELIRRSDLIAKEIDASVTRLEADAVKTMTGYGLIVNQISPDQAQKWYKDGEDGINKVLGIAFDRDFYTRVQTILTNYRSKNR